MRETAETGRVNRTNSCECRTRTSSSTSSLTAHCLSLAYKRTSSVYLLSSWSLWCFFLLLATFDISFLSSCISSSWRPFERTRETDEPHHSSLRCAIWYDPRILFYFRCIIIPSLCRLLRSISSFSHSSTLNLFTRRVSGTLVELFYITSPWSHSCRNESALPSLPHINPSI